MTGNVFEKQNEVDDDFSVTYGPDIHSLRVDIDFNQSDSLT